MKITSLRPGDGAPIIARFDWEMSEDLKLLNWTLKRSPSGEFRAHPPNVRGTSGSPVAVTTTLMREITAAAIEFMTSQGGRAPNDDRTIAA